jgi:antibiotic biosynthesis monooxygenase (ABM) superfamily enzyme
MTTQVRVYRVTPGRVCDFADEWRTRVAPLRRSFGFEIIGAWASEEADTFVWIISHTSDFAEADRAYYSSAERKALDPDPARLIEEQHTFVARPLALP